MEFGVTVTCAISPFLGRTRRLIGSQERGGKGKVMRIKALLIPMFLLAPAMATAAQMTVTGRVIMVQGRQSSPCRVVFLRKVDGTVFAFRMSQSQVRVEDAIAATSLTAQVTGYNADIGFDPAILSGCGAEPVITHITLHAPGF